MVGVRVWVGVKEGCPGGRVTVGEGVKPGGGGRWGWRRQGGAGRQRLAHVAFDQRQG